MNWKRSAFAVIAAVPVIALLANGMGKDPSQIPSPLPGREAPNFELALLDPAVLGRPASSGAAASGSEIPTVRLQDLKGQVVVLNFFASWCLACRDEHQPLTQTAAAYEGRGVKFFGVAYNDKPADSRRWIAQMGGQSYPALMDPGSRTAIEYGLYGVPETFFIGKDGKVAFKQIGPVNAELLTQKLDSLLAMPDPAAPIAAP